MLPLKPGPYLLKDSPWKISDADALISCHPGLQQAASTKAWKELVEQLREVVKVPWWEPNCGDTQRFDAKCDVGRYTIYIYMDVNVESSMVNGNQIGVN